MLSPRAWYLATAPIDLRCGTDRLLLLVHALSGGAMADGAYVFRNRSGTRIKLLSCDRHGVWLAVRRLQQGRFVWPRTTDAAWTLSADQFAWLCAGVDWQRLSIAPMSHAQPV